MTKLMSNFIAIQFIKLQLTPNYISSYHSKLYYIHSKLSTLRANNKRTLELNGGDYSCLLPCKYLKKNGCNLLHIETNTLRVLVDQARL